MRRFILVIIASAILALVMTRCTSFGKRLDEESNGEVVIPKISEAEPSELKSPSQVYGDDYGRLNEEGSWNLVKIVASSPVDSLNELSPSEAHPSPIESTNLPIKEKRAGQSSNKEESDSLRDILKDRARQISMALQEDDNKTDRNTGSSDFGENVFPSFFFRCAVLRGGKFKSGDRITLRALENVSTESITVSKHDLIEGYCTVEDRVQIIVHRVNGNAVTLVAFDPDGMKGLWYSDQRSETLSSLGDEIVRDGSSLLSNRVGRLARGFTSVGVDAAGRRKNSAAVEIPSGYELLLGAK